MGRVRCTAEEAVDNLNRRASEVRQALLKNKVEMCMKHHPQCIETVWEQLRSLGFDDSSIKTHTEKCVMSFQARALEPRKKAKIEEKEEHDTSLQQQLADEEEEEEDVPLRSDPLPTILVQIRG